MKKINLVFAIGLLILTSCGNSANSFADSTTMEQQWEDIEPMDGMLKLKDLYTSWLSEEFKLPTYCESNVEAIGLVGYSMIGDNSSVMNGEITYNGAFYNDSIKDVNSFAFAEGINNIHVTNIVGGVVDSEKDEYSELSASLFYDEEHTHECFVIDLDGSKSWDISENVIGLKTDLSKILATSGIAQAVQAINLGSSFLSIVESSIETINIFIDSGSNVIENEYVRISFDGFQIIEETNMFKMSLTQELKSTELDMVTKHNVIYKDGLLVEHVTSQRFINQEWENIFGADYLSSTITVTNDYSKEIEFTKPIFSDEYELITA